MKPEELKEHKLETIAEIEKYLNELKKNDSGNFLNIGDMMCRVGELESTVIWQFDLARDSKAEPRSNRLCECYDHGDY